MNTKLSFNPERIFNLLVYVFFVGYIVFIPLGPYPIRFLGTKLDVFFASVLLLLLLPTIPRMVGKYPPLLVYVVYFYMCTSFLSVVLSTDLLHSMRNWMVTLGYVLLCFLAPIVISARIRSVRTILLIMGVLVSVTILILYSQMGYGHTYRFAFRRYSTPTFADSAIRLDPNLTAIGLYMAILVYLPNLHRQNRSFPKRCVELCAFAIIGAGATITLSRTALISFTLSILFAVLLLFFRGLVDHRPKYTWNMVSVLLIFLLLAIGIVATFRDLPYARLADRISESGRDRARIGYIRNTLDIFDENLKNTLIGQGYFTTNPHNEFLRNLSSSGFLGFASFCMMFFAFYSLVVSRVRSGYYEMLGATGLYLYIFLAIQTYGHNKSMWVALMFTLTLYLDSIQSSSTDSDGNNLTYDH